MTTAGAFHSQNRSVGPRFPLPTSLAITSSRATWIAGCTGSSWITSKVWSCQLVAFPKARRTAMPIASGLKPIIAIESSSTPVIAAVSSATEELAGKPVNARSIRSSASSGSRKKSPERETRASRSSSTSTSTATSLPPGTLYSPRIGSWYARRCAIARLTPLFDPQAHQSVNDRINQGLPRSLDDVRTQANCAPGDIILVIHGFDQYACDGVGPLFGIENPHFEVNQIKALKLGICRSQRRTQSIVQGVDRPVPI